MKRLAAAALLSASVLTGSATAALAGGDYPAPTPVPNNPTPRSSVPATPGVRAEALPTTGGNEANTALVGAGLVAAGGALLVARRRATRQRP